MKENNIKKIILSSFILAIILITLIVFSNTNNSYALELNEEYVKEDFVISEDGKVLKGFSESGKEKLKRNDYKLVLDGNVLGPIEEIGEKAFVGLENLSTDEFPIDIAPYNVGNYIGKVEKVNEKTKEYISSLEFRNMLELKRIQKMAFKGNNLQNVDFNGAPNVEKLGIECFAFNFKLYEVDIRPLKSLNKHLVYQSSFINCGFIFIKNGEKNELNKRQINVIVHYKDPLNLSFGYYNNEDDKNFNTEEEYQAYLKEQEGKDQPGGGAKDIYTGIAVFDPVSTKLYIISNKFNEAQTCELSEIEDGLNEAFNWNDEAKEKWLEEKGYKNKEEETQEKYNKIQKEIETEIKRIEDLEALKETNEQLLEELNVVENKILEYKKHCCEIKKIREEALLERLKERLEEIKKTVGEHSYEYMELEYKIREMQNKCCSAEAIKEIKKELEKITLEKQVIEKELETIKLQLEIITKENEKNKEENKELNKQIEELNKKITEINETIKTKDQKIKELEEQAKNIKTENTEKDKKIEELEKKITKLEEENKKREEKLKENEETIKKITEENEKLKEDQEKNKETIEQNNKKIEELEKELKETKQEIENIKEEIKKSKEECKKDFNEELTKRDEEIERLKKKIEELEKKNKKIEEKLNKKEEPKETEEKENTSITKTNNKKTNKKDTKSNNKLPYAGSESVIILSLITIGAIIYTKRVMKRK